MFRMIAGGIAALIGIIWLGIVVFVAFAQNATINPAVLIAPVIILIAGLILIFWGATAAKK